MTTISIPHKTIRGIELAKKGVRSCSVAEMALFARSLAHEVVDQAYIPQVEDEASWCAIADAWAMAAKSEVMTPQCGDARTAAISGVLQWLAHHVGIEAASGLESLGWDSWYSAIHSLLGIEQGEHDDGVETLVEMLEGEFAGQSASRALEAIPSSAYVEMSYMQFWNGLDRDGLVDEVGLQYKSYHLGVDTIRANQNFARMLRFYNVSLPDLIRAIQKIRPSELDAFKENLKEMHPGQRSVLQKTDSTAPSLMSAEDVITVLENAAEHAIPNISFQVRLRDLLATDPAQPMLLASKDGKFHIGAHDGMVNGAGYMDSFKPSAPLAISLAHGALISEKRWNTTLYSLYWHRKSAYRVEITQESVEQMEVTRLLERFSGE